MDNKTSITALMSVFGRAYHAKNTKEPIFADTKARELMTDKEYSMIADYILGGIDFFAPDKKDSFTTGEEMKSCFDQKSLELMLSEYGFLVYEHLNYNEIQDRFFSGRNDWLSAFEHISYAHAVLKR